jgi:hypothetical protein
MALDLSPPKEFVAGMIITCTVVSDKGKPRAAVKVDGADRPTKVYWLSEAKYKILFDLPSETKGKGGEIEVACGEEKATHAFEIA